VLACGSRLGPYGGMDLKRSLIFGLGFTLILKRLWARACDFLDWVRVKINLELRGIRIGPKGEIRLWIFNGGVGLCDF